MCEVVSIALLPHMLLSSRRHFLKAELEGSRISRAYASLSKDGGGLRSNVLCPDNQPTPPNHRFEGPLRTAYILPRKGRY